MTDKEKKKVAIIGGGLVGPLQACFMAKRGYDVQVFEMRSDSRKAETNIGRSINLALSCRGRESLRAVGIEDEITSNGIEMFGRMIHDLDGKKRFIPYGKNNQYIMSIHRGRLNELLLTSAEKFKNVKLQFNHKINSIDFEKKQIKFKKMDSDSEQLYEFDIIMGCDGAFSQTRNQLMKVARINYSQEFIEDGYIELRIPPTENKEFMMEKNYLHIWPRQTFMMIALPENQGKSFVVTLFMSFKIFEKLVTDDDIIEFFEKNFRDALDMMGKDSIIETFRRLIPLPLVSIKSYPYHYKDQAVLLGDAAHAMVPFYGQGLNCGFEDLLVFDDLMEKFNCDFEKVLENFSNYRSIDAQSMNDLALMNYKEMRSDVNSKLFILRKKLDGFLYWLFPKYWIPLYTTVSFTRMRYHKCIENKAWQDKTISTGLQVIKVGMIITLAYASFKLYLKNESLLNELIFDKI